MKKIAFIGPGKVGTSLANYFRSKGYQVTGFYGVDHTETCESAEKLAMTVYRDLPTLVNENELIFITVPDDAIPLVWETIKADLRDDQWVFHCSGGKGTEVFSQGQNPVFSLHPITAFASPYCDVDQLAETYFTLQGTRETTSVLEFFARLGNPIAVIEQKEKVKYHAACVLLANQLIALADTGIGIFEASGLPADFAQAAWRSLFRNNCENLLTQGTIAALTGPIERNDRSTVQAHLEELSGDERELYRLLSKRLLKIAEQKHPTRDYQEIKGVLAK